MRIENHEVKEVLKISSYVLLLLLFIMHSSDSCKARMPLNVELVNE
jgi:hypothetical protein